MVSRGFVTFRTANGARRSRSGSVCPPSGRKLRGQRARFAIALVAALSIAGCAASHSPPATLRQRGAASLTAYTDALAARVQRAARTVVGVTAVRTVRAPPGSPLWHMLQSHANTPLPEVTSLARRLAATALERGIFPVILTTLDQSGFERFGFRVERLTEAGRAGEEAELAGFRNFALILDADDLMLMG